VLWHGIYDLNLEIVIMNLLQRSIVGTLDKILRLISKGGFNDLVLSIYQVVSLSFLTKNIRAPIVLDIESWMRDYYINNNVSLPLNTTCIIVLWNLWDDTSVKNIINFYVFHPYWVIANYAR